MKSATLLTVGSHVHWDTKFCYLSYDSFRSSTTFIRKDGRFCVSFNKLDSRWKQTVFSGRLWQNIVPGLAVPVATEPGSSKVSFEKMYFLCFVPQFESRCMKIVTLLTVGSHVHWDTKFCYLSYDSFRSSTTFIRRDGRFGVSSNKLDRDGSRQFSGSFQQTVVPGHAVPVAIKPVPSTTLFEKNVTSLLRSTNSEQVHEECYASNCRQPRSLGH